MWVYGVILQMCDAAAVCFVSVLVSVRIHIRVRLNALSLPRQLKLAQSRCRR